MKENFEELKNIVDDGTTYIEIDTPTGWKCERQNCGADYKHKHTTFNNLS